VRDALQRVTLPAAVVSNSRMARVNASVRRAGLQQIFGERIFSAEQVARPKPYPDVYLFAAKTLGVEPARCVVVEDSVAGLNAARAAGMKTIAFVGASHIPEGYADALRKMGMTRIMKHMDELPRWSKPACVVSLATCSLNGRNNKKAGWIAGFRLVTNRTPLRH
jgi:haloacid dehalogenase superfamily, subfamily IA, variant 3 with third motif having DD or ED